MHNLYITLKGTAIIYNIVNNYGGMKLPTFHSHYKSVYLLSSSSLPLNWVLQLSHSRTGNKRAGGAQNLYHINISVLKRYHVIMLRISFKCKVMVELYLWIIRTFLMAETLKKTQGKLQSDKRPQHIQ